MRHLRLLIIAIATICVMALGTFALVNRQIGPAPGDDDIIIKGGSIEAQCGKNHKKDCFGVPDLTTGKYKRLGADGKHIVRVVVKDSAGGQLSNNNFDKDHQPTIIITYK
ncbi:MAG: hypothetical protein H7Z16_10005 [Pyrinomonadaceae bacterium]|nr:hypothetical protein [Pyrinomonadaceae bacterium]